MINVLFQTESHFPVSSQKIKDKVVEFLSARVKSQSEVSITIVGDRRMQTLNRTYRQVDATTDVLSFPQNDPTQQAVPFVDAPDGVLRLGDVVVSYPQAVLEATEENKLVDDKIIELIEHGINHLLGIHHPE